MVDNRYDVGKTLARAGAARQDEGFALFCLDDRRTLVFMQVQLLTGMIGVGLIKAEDTCTLRVKNPLLCQVINCSTREKRWIKL